MMDLSYPRGLYTNCVSKLTKSHESVSDTPVEPTPKSGSPSRDDLDEDILIRSLSLHDGSDGDSFEYLREYEAEVYLIERGVKYFPPALVARVMEKKAPRGPVQEKSYAEMKSFLNVMHRNHGSNESQICCFHSCKPNGCNRSDCRWAHEERESKYCTLGGQDTESCPNGAWCKLRHKDDIYVIWFYDRKTKLFKKYLWKDYRSKFSKHYKSTGH